MIARSRKGSGISRKSVGLLVLALLILTAVLSVSAQEDTQVGDVVILSEVAGPDGTDVVVEIPVFQDTYIVSGTPNANYGRSATIRLGHNAGGLGAFRPLLQFNLSAIPAGATINSAAFRIYLHAATPGDSPMPFNARHLVSSWNENLVTWNSHQPQWGSVFATGVAEASPLGWKQEDVTVLVQDWFYGIRPNNGFTVIGDERPEVERQRYYYSKEAGNNLYPRLIVDFTIPPPDNTPPFASVNPLPTWSRDTFQVSWSGQDNPGGSGIAFYDVQYRVNGGNWNDWRMRTTQTSSTFSGGVNNAFYEFRARAVDKAGNQQGWTGAQANTRVDTAPPTTFMAGLPQYTTSSSFSIGWSGNDGAGSGIVSYDVQGRLDGGPWQTILQNTQQTSHLVTGLTNGAFVEFRTRARDAAGNVQPFPGPQAATTVVLEPVAVVLPFTPAVLNPSQPITDSFTVQWVGFTVPGTTITAYELQYRFRPTDSLAYTPWATYPIGSPTDQSVEFSGPFTQDGTYEFEVRALNSIGQQEPFSNTPEAQKIVDLQPPFIVIRSYLTLSGNP